MVLSDLEIQAEIGANRLVFDPPINERERISSSSVDLSLHEEIIVLPANVQGIIIDPAAPGIEVMNIVKTHGKVENLSKGKVYHMKPNQLIIAKTLEAVTLPLHIAARIEGKSSQARIGISLHVTAPTVHAGFQGNLYLEMYNIGPFEIVLKSGMEIAQLILEHVGLPAQRGYSGQFQKQL